MSDFRIAACQMNSQNDKDPNLETADRLIDKAATLGTQMVGLPEMFNMLGEDQDTLNEVESLPGPTSEFLSNKACQHQMYIHGGSIPIKVPDSEKVWNSTLVFDPEGEIISRYNKIHFFDIHIEG